MTREFTARARSLQDVAYLAYEGSWPVAIRKGDEITRMRRSLVSGNYFDVLGTRAALGRALQPADNVFGAAPVVVISHDTWHRQFGDDPNVVGTTLTLEEFGWTSTIVGVMPEGLEYPAAVSVIATAHIYMMSGGEKIAMYERLERGDVPTVLVLLDPLKYLSGISYSVATVLYLRRHRRRVEDSYSNTARVNLVWLLWLAGAATAIWLLATTLRITDFGARLSDEHVTLAMALLVYAIGYMGLRQPEIFRYETAEYPIPARHEAAPAPVSAPEAGTPASRYERSGLSDVESARLESELLAVMQRERPWTNSELTLPELAARVNSTPHKLSEILNSRIGLSFYDFVNGYRVREVQRRIQAGEARTRKMLALALDAGFASKSTFNEAFKKHTLKTPSDFRETVGA
jgi:AraC-like DNA-binding protein